MGVAMTKGDRERLRAELAGRAMQALLPSKGEIAALASKLELGPVEYLAIASVRHADALLAELDRTADEPIKAGGTE